MATKAIRQFDATELETLCATTASAVSWKLPALLVFSDWLAVSFAASASVGARYLLDGQFTLQLYLGMWPVCLFFLAAYAVAGLYPTIVMSSVEEFRRASIGTSFVYLVLGTTTFLTKDGELYSRGIFLVGWAITTIAVPLGRNLCRRIVASRPNYALPVVVLGAGATGARVVELLQSKPHLGLRPVAVLDDDCEKHGHLRGVPVLGGLDLAPTLAHKVGIHWAVLAMPSVSREVLVKVMHRHAYVFPNLLFIPDMPGFPSLWVTARDVGGILGLQVNQALLRPGARIVKRALDIALAIVAGVFFIPLSLFLALTIRLDSPGPALFGHRRVGRDGKPLRVWKFRSMVQNSDSLLEGHFRSHPAVLEEWESSNKLKNDPRVTRVGKFLRKTSLDELPQIINVIKGEMSWVGPRPIVASEVKRYRSFYQLYGRVKPGVTGLWQVSGRNNTTYDERVALDVYYVQNWSVWLDLHILARTISVVLRRRGAF